MAFSNFVKDEPKGNPYLHMNFDAGFAWDTKDDANDQDNGFICKKQHAAWINFLLIFIFQKQIYKYNFTIVQKQYFR